MKSVRIIGGSVLIMFLPAIWFGIQAIFWWDLLPWFLALPAIFISQVFGIAVMAVLITAINKDVAQSVANLRNEPFI